MDPELTSTARATEEAARSRSHSPLLLSIIALHTNTTLTSVFTGGHLGHFHALLQEQKCYSHTCIRFVFLWRARPDSALRGRRNRNSCPGLHNEARSQKESEGSRNLYYFSFISKKIFKLFFTCVCFACMYASMPCVYNA